MFKRTKSPSPPLTSSSALELHPRNPRVHRQSGIPSINRPKGLNCAGVSNSNETNIPPSRSTRSSATKTAYQHLHRGPSSHRRVASMPQPLPSVTQAQIDIDGDKIARGLVSPPLVDFTRFEDQYRGPRNGNFEGLVIKTTQTNGRRVSIKSILKRNPSGVTKNNSTVDKILDTLPASTRKPDPRLIISTLEVVLLDSPKKPADVLDVYDLLGTHQLDQMDFEEREIARGNNSQILPRGEMGRISKTRYKSIRVTDPMHFSQWFSENLYEKHRSMRQRRWFWGGVNTNYRSLWFAVLRNYTVQVNRQTYHTRGYTDHSFRHLSIQLISDTSQSLPSLRADQHL